MSPFIGLRGRAEGDINVTPTYGVVRQGGPYGAFSNTYVRSPPARSLAISASFSAM